MASAKIALYALTSGIVVDQVVLNTVSTADLAANLEIIRNSKKPVRVVYDAYKFFTSDNMLKLIKANDDGYKLIAEKVGLTVRDEDVDAIRRVEAIIEAMKPPLPPYTFVDVPEEWTTTKALQITGTTIKSVRRRFTNAQGDGTNYTIRLAMMKRIWLAASAYWAKVPESSSTISKISADGYTRTGRTYQDRVEIGCQTVRRYELEQLALAEDWPFPEPVKS